MSIKVSLRSRSGLYDATGLFTEGMLIVKKGSHINSAFAEHIRGGKKAKAYRENTEFVDPNGIVVKDCSFTSPSTAAQFVTGCSSNGYRVWKDANGTPLGELVRK